MGIKSLHVIGDSISIQYGPYLKTMLSGQLEYDRPGRADESVTASLGADVYSDHVHFTEQVPLRPEAVQELRQVSENSIEAQDGPTDVGTGGPQMRIVVITGVSGAGKSEAVRSFEDMGYFCIDNLPPELVRKSAELFSQSDRKVNRIALVIDVRSGESFAEVLTDLEDLRRISPDFRILFLEASDEALLRRFKETRRRHPLGSEGGILEGIHRERQMLSAIKAASHHIIDTSSLSARELRNKLIELFSENVKSDTFSIAVVSFGFKFGIPLDADLVFDCRFLPNPYWVESLRPLTGEDPEVRNYVTKWPVTHEFMERLFGLLDFLVPNYIEEGRSHLIVGIGCTGGRHRSVVLAEDIVRFLQQQGYSVTLEHRDMSASSARTTVEEAD
jgi:UPF0042 nucleotide-binding protein